MYLLDTNVVSELRRHERANPGVARWSDRVSPADLFISVVTILELEIGTLAIERRDPGSGKVLRAWLDSKVMPAFDERILAVDTAVARACAKLHVPDRRPERDAMIAATALVHDLTVVTRNAADFAGIGDVRVFNPWESPLA